MRRYLPPDKALPAILINGAGICRQPTVLCGWAVALRPDAVVAAPTPGVGTVPPWRDA
jgi:hypothetical protein